MRRSIALAFASALLVACAPLIDFDGLTNGAHDAASPDGDAEALDASHVRDAATDSPLPIDAAHGDAGNPCAAVKTTFNGIYCGKSTENGFTGGSPNILYTCQNGVLASTQTCSNGCFTAQSGFPDSCDECNLKRDGVWCGAEFPGYAALLKDVVFVCKSGTSQGQPTACAGATPHCRPADGGASCGP